jgi:hypothetical protein
MGVKKFFAILIPYLERVGISLPPQYILYYPTITTRYALFVGAVANDTVTVFASVLTTSVSTVSKDVLS